MFNASGLAPRRYQHLRRNRQSGRFTPRNSGLSVPTFIRLRPEVRRALQDLVDASGETISFVADAILAERLRVGSSAKPAEAQAPRPIDNISATPLVESANAKDAANGISSVEDGGEPSLPNADEPGAHPSLQDVQEWLSRPSGGHSVCGRCGYRHGKLVACLFRDR